MLILLIIIDRVEPCGLETFWLNRKFSSTKVEPSIYQMTLVFALEMSNNLISLFQNGCYFVARCFSALLCHPNLYWCISTRVETSNCNFEYNKILYWSKIWDLVKCRGKYSYFKWYFTLRRTYFWPETWKLAVQPWWRQ